jgi:hypothetical protein
MKTTIAIAFAHLLVVPCFAGAGAPDKPSPSLSPGIDRNRVYFDAPGDGALWARGESWKMSFGAEGATYVPRFVSREETSLPHRLSPDLVTVGEGPLAFERAVTAVRSGNRVEFDRGAFVEAYELEPRSLEQSFVFASLPRAGDLVLRIPIARELPAEIQAFEDAGGVALGNELGSVHYSRAVATDAAGERIDASTRIEDGSIVIRVDGVALATAAFPLVIDPVVTDVWINTTLENDQTPDVAWDPIEGVWMVVYDDIFSATDADVFVQMILPSGALSGGAFVDQTTASWASPRIADLASAQSFLVVAEITRVTPHYVRGRIVEPNGTIVTLGSQFDVAYQGSSGNEKIRPDVGGDPTSDPNSTWCVCFQESFPTPAGEIEIACRRVARDGTVLGTMSTYLETGGGATQQPSYPSISKSNGGGDWLVAWQRAASTFDAEIRARYIHKDGTRAAATLDVTTGDPANDYRPCVSSPLEGSGRSLVSFTRFASTGSGQDTMLAAIEGDSVLQVANLSTMQVPGDTRDQVESSVDSDGHHFVVAYSEIDPVSGNYAVLASDGFLSGGSIGIWQPRIPLHDLSLWERHSQISAQHLSTGRSGRYFAVYDVRENDNDFDVAGQLFDAFDGGTRLPFCFGDGTGIHCPCLNDGATGHGCGNSVNPSGALLQAAGTASPTNDSLDLSASGMPPTASCVFIQGSSSIAGATYGDGIRCFAGTLVRIGVHTASNGNAVYPLGAETPISVKGGIPATGGTRYYQVWYRNPPPFCTSATTNVTNGIAVMWAP